MMGSAREFSIAEVILQHSQWYEVVDIVADMAQMFWSYNEMKVERTSVLILEPAEEPRRF